MKELKNVLTIFLRASKILQNLIKYNFILFEEIRYEKTYNKISNG